MQRRRHRHYGLSNANQVLLALVVGALLFLALLRRNWLHFDADDAAEVKAGLWGIYVATATATQTTSWPAFCARGSNHSLPMPIGEPQPLTDGEAQMLCARLTGGALLPSVVRGAIAAGIGLAALSVVSAIYLHFGAPSREQVFWVGTVPGLALFVAAVLGTTVLILWQARYRPFDNGDCFGIVVAATVIAYGVAISMVIRWRWPGVCAVPNEQQALSSRSNDDALLVFRQRLRRQRQQQQQGGEQQQKAREDAPAVESPRSRWASRGATAFHQLV